MSFSENISAVEAILFAYGEPIARDLLAEASGIEKNSLPKIINLLNDRYDENNSALYVLRLDDSYQIATRKEYSSYVKKAFESGRMAALSPAAMASLAIVAYNQPVTKGTVESVRGVDSSSVLNKLVERGLIEESERLEVPGRPVAYKTTKNFLRCFGLSSLDDLPSVSEKKDEPDLFSSQSQAD